jgi:hypothetical protein
MLQLSAINIQLKGAGRVFRLYIKSLGDKAVCRVEESVMTGLLLWMYYIRLEVLVNRRTRENKQILWMLSLLPLLR